MSDNKDSEPKDVSTKVDNSTTPESIIPEPEVKPTRNVQQLFTSMFTQVQVSAVDKLSPKAIEHLFEMFIASDTEKIKLKTQDHKHTVLCFTIIILFIFISVLVFAGWCVCYGNAAVVQSVLTSIGWGLGGVGLTAIGKALFKRQD